VRSPKGISAFIEFTDVGAAAACHQAQQGLILASSDRGPIRVQFSKNPFGRKREPAPSQTGSPTAAQAATAPAVVQPSQPAYATTYALPMPQPVLPAAYYGKFSTSIFLPFNPELSNAT